jgi:sugar diacid utilization regulator
VPESVQRLLELPPEGGLAGTLECYLDLAGDVKASAQALSLHRASLYYRLEKIESATGKDLKRGEDRLELQLGLKMARLLRVYP